MKTTSPAKSKRALYVRVSTEAQAEEGYSVAAQTERLEAYCKAMGWQDYELYVDGGFSGSNLDRPRMRQLIADAEKGTLRAVVVYKLDRLSRSQKDTLFLIEDVFLPNGIDFISLNESIDTSTPYGRAMIGILSAFAQLERENIFLRTRMGMLERVKQGYWPGGGGIPFGYDYDSGRGILVPNEDAKTVRQMYELYIKGYSAQKLADMFGLSSDRLVMLVLARRSNLGVIPYKGEEYPGRHEAIVSEEVFALAQRKMRERSKARATPAGAHLLTGLLYCGHCGARLRYCKWGKAGYKLVCYSHDRSKPHMIRDPDCVYRPVWAEPVETAVLDDLFRLSADTGSADPARDDAFDPLTELRERITRLEGKLRRLYDLYAAEGDEILLDTIAENRRALQLLREEASAEEKHRETSRQLRRIRARLSQVSELWEHLSGAERQALIRDCVQRIVVTNDKIEIYYTFRKKDEKPHAA